MILNSEPFFFVYNGILTRFRIVHGTYCASFLFDFSGVCISANWICMDCEAHWIGNDLSALCARGWSCLPPERTKQTDYALSVLFFYWINLVNGGSLLTPFYFPALEENESVFLIQYMYFVFVCIIKWELWYYKYSFDIHRLLFFNHHKKNWDFEPP